MSNLQTYYHFKLDFQKVENGHKIPTIVNYHDENHDQIELYQRNS